MKKIHAIILSMAFCLNAAAQTPFSEGRLTVTPLSRNAVRIQYAKGDIKSELPEWIYVKQQPFQERQDISVAIDAQQQVVKVCNAQGLPVFTATNHQFKDGEATLSFVSPDDEFLYGLGQFQDGYSNVRGLSRRLTQVNTFHPHAHLEQGLRHLVEQLRTDGV